MRLFTTTCLLMCLSFTAHGAGAQLSERSQAEIDHLINVIANNPCQFVRNGRGHSQQEAVAHIREKLDYFRDDIKDAETFIELTATKSTLTGRPYLIQCLDKPVKLSRLWLLQELKQYRAANP